MGQLLAQPFFQIRVEHLLLIRRKVVDSRSMVAILDDDLDRIRPSDQLNRGRCPSIEFTINIDDIVSLIL